MAKYCRLCGKKLGLFEIADLNHTCFSCVVKKADEELPITPEKSVSLKLKTAGFDNFIELRVDDTKKQFALSFQPNDKKSMFVAYRLFDYAKLKSVQLMEDGATVMSSNAGATLAGGLLLGGLGAAMGASSARTMSKSIYSIDLQLLIDDIDCPKIVIPVYRGETNTQAD